MTSLGIGLIGARSTVAERAILPAVDRSDQVHLSAVCSLSGRPPGPLGDAVILGTYDQVVDHPEVEAVYVPLPNHMHAEWTERAAAAGKHVLCEKPLAANAATARRMVAACDRAGVVLAEAWMTPFATRWQVARHLFESGRVGRPERVDAVFTFTIGPEHHDNYRWRAAMGGGALLDVGIYCLGPAVELWGAEPNELEVEQHRIGDVDATTVVTARWDGSCLLSARCSFEEPDRQELVYSGSDGALRLVGEAHTGGRGAGGIDITTSTGTERLGAPTNDPYQAMLEAFAAAVRGEREWPRPIGRSIDMLALFDRIRAAAIPLNRAAP